MGGRAGRSRTVAASVLLGGLVAACGGSPPAAAGTAPATTRAPTSRPEATVTPASVAELSACPTTVTASHLTVLRHMAQPPDDVMVDARGNVWVSARAADQVVTLSPSGVPVTTTTVSGGPEGIVSASGRTLVATEAANTVVSAGSGRSVSIPDNPAQTGLDGLGVDPSGAVLVPDSSTGTLYRLDWNSGQLTVVARDLSHPVAAIPWQGGYLVAQDAAQGLVQINASGAASQPMVVGALDDLVADGHVVYATDTATGRLLAIDPSQRAVIPLVTGLPSPQGVAVTAAGGLVLTDSTTQNVYVMRGCRS